MGTLTQNWLSTKWILVLHGSSENGNDLIDQQNTNLTYHINNIYLEGQVHGHRVTT